MWITVEKCMMLGSKTNPHHSSKSLCQSKDGRTQKEMVSFLYVAANAGEFRIHVCVSIICFGNIYNSPL